jgi:urease beta subunit
VTGVPLSPLPGLVGEVLVGQEPVVVDVGDRPTARVVVANTSDWPVVITSHFHFFEANQRLRFDRGAAFGLHLDLPAGSSARFDPGQTRAVDLVGYAGERALHGFNGLTNAVLGTGEELERQRAAAVARARAAGFLDSTADDTTADDTTADDTDR